MVRPVLILRRKCGSDDALVVDSVIGTNTATTYVQRTVYDGNGKRVKGVVGNVTTSYIGNYYEYSTQTSGITPGDADGNEHGEHGAGRGALGCRAAREEQRHTGSARHAGGANEISVAIRDQQPAGGAGMAQVLPGGRAEAGNAGEAEWTE
jgi:hypothetical protein